jgi:hypothetical protein
MGRNDSPQRLPVTISAIGGAAFSITSVQNLPAGVTCEYAKAQTDVKHCITFVLTPERATLPLWQEIRIRTDHPLQPVFNIQLAAIADVRR